MSQSFCACDIPALIQDGLRYRAIARSISNLNGRGRFDILDSVRGEDISDAEHLAKVADKVIAKQAEIDARRAGSA